MTTETEAPEPTEQETPDKAPRKKRVLQIKYTPRLVKKILDQIGIGNSISDICSMEGMPSKEILYQWIRKRDGFAQKFAAARVSGFEFKIDDLLIIADDNSRDKMVATDRNDNPRTDKDGNVVMTWDKDHILRSRLMVETRKWILTKLYPRTYGDAVNITQESDALKEMNDVQLDSRINALMSARDKKTDDGK